MAVPKRKTSRSNTRSRRANWKATPVALTTCPQCGRPTTADYANRRTVHTLVGVTRLNLTIRRCHHPAARS